MSPNDFRRASTARVFRVPSASGTSLILEHEGGYFDLSHGFENARHADLLELVARGFFERLPRASEAPFARCWPARMPATVSTPFEPRQIGKILALTRPPRELFERLAAGDSARWFANRSPASLVASGASIQLPEPGDVGELGQPDPGVLLHAAFLAVVILRRASGLRVEDAMGSVAGYMLASDFTRRTLDGRPRTPWFGQSPVGTLAIGPAFVPRAALELEHVVVRAEKRCADRSEPQVRLVADFAGDVSLAVAALSRLAILHPGDLVLVPTGVGLGVVDAGDEVRCAIEGIGELATHVRRRVLTRQQA